MTASIGNLQAPTTSALESINTAANSSKNIDEVNLFAKFIKSADDAARGAL